MKTPSEELLKRAAGNDLSALIELDSAGFLPCPGENAEKFVERIRSMLTHCEFFREKTADGRKFEVYDSIVISEKDRIPEEIMAEASRKTSELYGFSIFWVPGYFIDRGLGLLWGGCALSENEPDSVPVFIIKSTFRKSPKWFIYRREELLAHELCHAARAPFMDPLLEEHFAYATSRSALRRTTGNCFQHDRDAILFLLPVFLLLGIQIAINVFDAPLVSWPFWILAFVWPAYLLTRNFFQRRIYFRAEEKIRKLGFSNPRAVLFRCTAKEIRFFSSASPDALSARFDAPEDVRTCVIVERFRKNG